MRGPADEAARHIADVTGEPFKLEREMETSNTASRKPCGRWINSTPSLLDVAKSSGRLVVRTARHKVTHSIQCRFVSSAFSLGSPV